MRYKCREIEHALKKKGFVEIRSHNHKKFYFQNRSGRFPIKTITSHSNPEYSGILLSQLIHQLHLSPEQFHDLIQCPLSKEKLEEIYVSKFSK
ncbi:hypothetical protein MmiEs2_09860 [Methanimicrococcus stummii]|uniref:Type II toxin-antitoxin system HicA family toxin n=1 Tax=Methanimicrococcus stummii TaxID=3028294 RepID=A0AA96V8N9_9EURY|nr:type II toxin-antitoxin system HicA family toxin [Methanimicrococcus sp. Es2]WNY28782.1 hypothetical protein MmiEs2_09860 [Methanimicrococcus sp. Es2]